MSSKAYLTKLKALAEEKETPFTMQPLLREGCVCLIEGEWCGAFSPNCNYSCSRPIEHKGPHVACGGTGRHRLTEWPSDSIEEIEE